MWYLSNKKICVPSATTLPLPDANTFMSVFWVPVEVIYHTKNWAWKLIESTSVRTANTLPSHINAVRLKLFKCSQCDNNNHSHMGNTHLSYCMLLTCFKSFSFCSSSSCSFFFFSINFWFSISFLISCCSISSFHWTCDEGKDTDLIKVAQAILVISTDYKYESSLYFNSWISLHQTVK